MLVRADTPAIQVEMATGAVEMQVVRAGVFRANTARLAMKFAKKMVVLEQPPGVASMLTSLRTGGIAEPVVTGAARAVPPTGA